MRDFYLRNYIVTLSILVLALFIERYFNQEKGYEISFIIISIPVTITLFNLLIRRIIWFKSYFLSGYNILTSKRRFQKEFDFSKDILFHKLIESIQNAKYKIVKTDENTGDIFAIFPIGLDTSGENIYITLEENNSITTADFHSVYFQSITNRDNKSTYNRLIKEFEKSLII